MNEMKPRWTFRAVLNNGDDQVIVRQLLEKYVCEHDRLNIIAGFNAEVAAYNRRVADLTALASNE